MEKDEYGSWIHKYYDRITPDVQKLFDEYEKRFDDPPYIFEQLDACSYMGYEELIEKVKICLEKNIDILHLEIPDYDELLKRGVFLG